MTIGEKIIAALVEKQELQSDWFDSATLAQLDALVAAHVEEQVRLRSDGEYSPTESPTD